MDGVKATVVLKKACEVKLNVVVEQDIINKERESIFIKIQNSVRVPGFRVGKAPIETIKAKFAERAEEELINSIVPKAVNGVLEIEKIEAVSYPKIHDFKMDDSKEITFSLIVETKPEFEVKDYKKIKLEKETLNVEEKDVNKAVADLCERYAKVVTDDIGIVGDSSFVTADYDAKLDGTPLTKESAKASFISIERGNGLPDFTKQLIGMKKADSKIISITFPSDYYKKDLAGKTAEYTVTINEIKKKELPELNKEFLQMLGLESEADLRQKIKEHLQQEQENSQKQNIKQQIVKNLVKNNDIEVPASIIQRQAEYMAERVQNYMQHKGGIQPKGDEEKHALKEKYMNDAKEQVQISYILNAIAEKEQIKVSDEEFQGELTRALDGSGNRRDEVQKYFNEHKNTIIARIEEDKIFKFLEENAKIKEIEKKTK
ncbi:MAG: trigger factor [Elusimicrobiota bacterium]